MNLPADSDLAAYKNNGHAGPASDETQGGLAKTVNGLLRMLDSSLDVICSLDENARFIYVGAAAERIWGYAPEYLTGKPIFDLILPEDLDITIKAAEEVIAGSPKTNFENRYLRKDGLVVPMVWSARWDATEKIMYCIGRDATEKKNAEEKLVQAEEHYRTIFYSHPL